ncbi:alpha/beta hydrolase [Oscillibacter sp. MSJ-2]|uniref:Alpha/beta hydrolase n=1 Tax=Dysosmobacter acutus TaxID=2841504 RepID=A0ABS6F7E9_9FIRM|nr:alpha/beta hydrolase [Dysosmobacter acutus]MBU5625993.1 alpha/beta hydrolase [Dysosmobacter acutus]
MGIAALALAAAGLAAFGWALFRKAVIRREDVRDPAETLCRRARRCGVDPMPMLQAARWLQSQSVRTVAMEGFDGLTLTADCLMAEGPSRGWVLLFHGYRSGPIQDFCMIAPELHRMGYDLLLVDQRSHGRSQGRYIGFGTLEQRDCRDWIDWVNRCFGAEQPIYLYGVSMGATTVLMAAGAELPGNVKGVVADCGFTSAGEILRHELKTLMHLPAFPMLWVVNGINRLLAGWSFFERSTLEAMKTIRVPVLFVHGGRDHFVPRDMTRRNFEACRSEKRLLFVEGADHGMSFAVDPEGYSRELARFMKNCE